MSFILPPEPFERQSVERELWMRPRPQRLRGVTQEKTAAAWSKHEPAATAK